MKKSKLESVCRDDISIAPTAKTIWRNIERSTFFSESVAKFNHYTNPTGYKKGRHVYILNNIPAVEVFLQSQETEILVEIIDIDEADVPHFLIAFLNKEHKEPSTTAELIKLFLNYTKSGEGKKWYDNYPDSKDKEEIISKVFGISTASVKAYLHLIQPGKEKYLDRLTDIKIHSLHEVYRESRDEEKNIKAASDTPNQAASATDSGKPIRFATSGAGSPTEITNDLTASRSPILSFGGNVNGGNVKKSEDRTDDAAVDESAFDEEVMRHEAQLSVDPEQNLVKKVIAYLKDGSQLQLIGKIHLKAKELPVKTTDHFKKCSDGTWFIPSLYGPVSIEVFLEDPIDA